ncbi:MAG: MBL fold metallo-hydrolase, partial [Deltaproteobacteria bacterium]
KGADGNISLNTFLAEHGLSLLVTVWCGGKKHRILLDTGYTGIPLIHNAELLRLDLTEIEALVLSHAHMDHTGGLHLFLDRIGKRIQVVVHPDAFLYPRFILLKDGTRQRFPRTLIRSVLEARNIEVVESRSPVLISEETILVSGEVGRRTGFEKGMPNAFVEKEGKEVKDSIPDDPALIMHLKGKGIVIISGCSHAGIINTLLHAAAITGEERIYGIMGWFHLSGSAYESILEQTVAELKKVNPNILVPMHCTGWNTMTLLARAFPSSMILNSVGSTITLCA